MKKLVNKLSGAWLRNAMMLAFFIVVSPCGVRAGVITADTVWQGEVRVAEDVLVPEGITLTIRPGTTIKVVAAESTKTDPEYVSPLTEITVRGTLRVEGTATSPVDFSGEEKKAGSWAGIVVDHGTATVAGCRIAHAETALHVFDGTLRLLDSTIRENRYGVVAQGEKSGITVENSRIADNDYGLFTLQGPHVVTTTAVVKGNRKKDVYSASVKEYRPEVPPVSAGEPPVDRRYKDEALRGDTVWQGRVEVGGIVRVPEGSRLIVMPGTIVEFSKKDTNGDGIGENGLLIQGRLIAKGTREHPIIFRSAEKEKGMGDWDAINIMNSAGAQNLIEYCRIEHAYRGLHFHFSTVVVQNSVLTNNYRGVQFQESSVDIKGNHLYANKSGVQGRDSDITFSDNVIADNYVGANFFRTNITARGNRIVGNWKEGLRIREGVSSLQENLIDGNRYGLMVADTYYGDYSRNSITNNLETGLSLKNVDNVEILGNIVAANGINGLNVQDTRAVIKGNQISDNGERGMGIISFDGVITENNFIANGQYAIDLDGPKDVSAPSNWWGGADVNTVIFDRKDDASRGRVAHEKASASPIPFAWPLRFVSTDTIWRGVITVNTALTVLPGAVLTVAPGTKVAFSQGTGLAVKGRIIAKGRDDGKIIFTSVQRTGASDWDEILLEYATGSEIAHAVFEYATWGIHCHFTNLSITDCHFKKNYGGMRFRSGPVQVTRSVFEDNVIGIRAYIGNAVIRENRITRNETGIFVREKGGGLTITRNDIFDNSNYNIRVGDFNNEDIDAKGNWWGTDNPPQTIFDGRNEPGIGNVLFEPALKEPVKPGVKELP
ncbi:hypothetical protein AOG1_03100 [Geobacter sp. AOG1]|nr:hypothetical protein AOG1_03100 [Geobacter sp. AOG1]